MTTLNNASLHVYCLTLNEKAIDLWKKNYTFSPVFCLEDYENRQYLNSYSPNHFSISEMVADLLIDVSLLKILNRYPLHIIIYIEHDDIRDTEEAIEQSFSKLLMPLNSEDRVFIIFNSNMEKWPLFSNLKKSCQCANLLLIYKPRSIDKEKFFSGFAKVLNHRSHSIGYLASYFKYVISGKICDFENMFYFDSKNYTQPIIKFL